MVQNTRLFTLLIFKLFSVQKKKYALPRGVYLKTLLFCTVDVSHRVFNLMAESEKVQATIFPFRMRTKNARVFTKHC